MTLARLLNTKFYLPPPRPDLVPRPRLLQRLVDAVERPLTLISAPAGFGKTTLVSEWRSSPAGRDTPVAWLSLDEDDNDPVRFLHYFVAALARLVPGLADRADSLLQGPQVPAPRALLADLATELNAGSPPAVLGLDDCHVITAPAIQDGLTYLLEHLPPNLRLIVCTRADPRWPLPRLRARNQLAEIRAADLRFTREETAAFLEQVATLTLPQADLAALEASTEGWAAGLQLAALALQSGPNAADFIRAFTGSHAYVIDYLVEEVLQRQPPEVQQFLLRTSILEQLTGPLCDALLDEGPKTKDEGGEANVTRRGPSSFALEELERSNLFLIPLDAERRWFRYHHLFGDVLRARFAQGWPELLPTLHTRAAAWLEQNGLPEPAIRHALVGGDVERAARLVEQQARPMMVRGELATLVAWAEALPEQVYRVRPRLLAERAMALTFSGNVREAQPLLEQLEQSLPGTGPGPAVRHLRGLIAIQRALVAELGGQDERVLALASAADKWLPADDFLARALIPYLRGRAHAAGGDLDAAEAAFRELVEISRLGNNIWTMSVAASELARVLKIRGRLRQAAEVYEQVLRLAEARGARQFAPLAVIEIGQADLLCEWNALEQARTLAETALGRAERWGNAGGRMYVRLHLACILLAQRDWAAMQRVLEQADDLRGQVPVLPEHGRQWMDLQVRLWLAQGRLDQARQWAETLDGAPAGPVYMRDAEQATLARVWLAHGYGARAAAILAKASGGAEAGGRVRALIELKALRALALGQAGQPGPAGGELMDSLRLARPEGFLRVFLDEGEPMHRLLADLKGQLGRRPRRGETGDERQLLGYVDYLLAGLRKPAGGATTTSAPPMAAGRQTRAGKPSPLVEPLSARELEVLRLVDQGLSNREMADRLVVSLSTVKKHVENIHAKLGVHSRTQALARARELELL